MTKSSGTGPRGRKDAEGAPAGPLRVGIAGLGTVGAGVVEMLSAQAETVSAVASRGLTVNAVSARDRTRDRGVDLSGMTWFEDPVELAVSDEIDLFVELIGGTDGPAYDAVTAALRAGKPVVTANKALIAERGLELAELAEAAGVPLKYEAAVAGGIPIVKVVRESVRADRVTRIYGILNGTTNFISMLMAQGESYEAALQAAQDAGYAEADPTFDVEGYDAAHKLAILASICFGTAVDYANVHCEGIGSVTAEDVVAADRLGYAIKLLGVALHTENGVEQRVHPTMVPRGSVIAGVNGVRNAVALEGEHVGPIMLMGRGAGAGPTAASVVSDLLDLARGDTSRPFVVPVADLQAPNPASIADRRGAYYVRFSVFDRLGVFAQIAQRMADGDISLERIVQHRSGQQLTTNTLAPQMPRELRVDEERTASIELITHTAREGDLQAAIAAIEVDGVLTCPPKLIRIESF
ncbi:MAG: homoserine dehydrogenase [Pseudomonadota bacterium]